MSTLSRCKFIVEHLLADFLASSADPKWSCGDLGHARGRAAENTFCHRLEHLISWTELLHNTSGSKFNLQVKIKSFANHPKHGETKMPIRQHHSQRKKVHWNSGSYLHSFSGHSLAYKLYAMLCLCLCLCYAMLCKSFHTNQIQDFPCED